MSKLSRRSLVTTAAALPALAVPAVAADVSVPDPIFAAMEEYRRLEKACDDRSVYEEQLDVKLTPAPGDHRTPEIVALVKAVIAARRKLAATSPTTFAGLTAILDYAASHDDEYETLLFDGDEETNAFLQSLAQCVRSLGRAAS